MSPRHSTIRRILRRTLVAVALTALAAAGGLGAYLAITWPDVAALARRNPADTAFIAAARERGVVVRWTWVGYDGISDDLKRAVLVAEDINFFSHHGFDTGELTNAVREALEGDRLRGASTLTQQLAKNLWLSPSRSPLRKLKEAILTWQLERHLSKRRILELYLNVAQFGPRIFGAEAAARSYFGERAAELDQEQAAELAASLPRPRTWHPGVESRGYRRYVARIMRRMERAQWLERLL